MGPRLILARHGNTFKPEDTPVWVGARCDLPLVEKGLTQAQNLAALFQKAHFAPDLIVAGPLLRTKQTGQIVIEILKMPIERLKIEPRLKEIDYGKWEGKSTTEIQALGDSEKLAAWNKNSVFPSDIAWAPEESQITENVKTLLKEAQKGTSLMITSNGILRFFARLARNANSYSDHKVLTGNICVMDYKEDDWYILQWNEPPERFLASSL